MGRIGVCHGGLFRGYVYLYVCLCVDVFICLFIWVGVRVYAGFGEGC